jgi:chitinase
MATTFTYERAQVWGQGLVGLIRLRPDQPLNGWTLAFDAAFDIVNIWGADIIRTAPGRYLVHSVDWTATAAPGQIIEFGFQAVFNTLPPDPSGFIFGGPNVTDFPGVPTTPPVLNLSDAIAGEAAGYITFVATLSHASSSAVQFRFATESGTARAVRDFVAQSGLLTFAPGETRKEIRIALTDDAVIENTESFGLTLSQVTGARLGDGTAIGTIQDNDAPGIRIADASMLEGNSGAAQMRFTVSLSHAATSNISLRFATQDGTATAGSDYVARSGGLVFLAGETEKVIAITVRGDRTVEADETFGIRITEVLRGVVIDGEATGTIRNDDSRPVTISIADAAPVTEGDPGATPLVGALSTRGSQIIDETGAAVKIAAVNWFGMETATMAPHGLHVRNWQDMMEQMAEQGFNAIRLPFSAQAILENGQPNGINYALNPDLVGLNSQQIMDKIVGYAGEIGLRILLDHHRSFAGDGPNGNGLWYDGRFTEARWIDMWEDLAARYAGNPTVIGADLNNEPFGALWNSWASAAERAGNAILAVNPDWLVVVEGVAVHAGQYYWWGGNLIGARDRPVDLIADDKLVYSPHDYPNSIYPQPHFSAPDFPANLPGVFDKYWGYLWSEGLAPVLLGEWGSRLTQAKDLAWFDAISAYLGGDIDNNGTKDRPDHGPSFAWWSWNPNSTDTGGILADDWQTVLASKVAALAPLLPAQGEAARQAVFDVSLSGAAAAPVTVGWRTVAGTASEADYVAASGTLTFAAGETHKSLAVLLRADDLAEAEEAFTLQLFNPVGATLADGTATARILDNDAVF